MAVGGAILQTLFQLGARPLVRTGEHAVNSALPTEFPDPGSLIRAWIAGEYTDAQVEAALRIAGVAWEPAAGGINPKDSGIIAKYKKVWAGVVSSQISYPGLPDTLALLMRGAITPAVATRYLQHLGYHHSVTTDRLLSLANQIPGPADLVRFVVRDVWEPSVTTKFGYHLEFPLEFEQWMKKQGFGHDLGTTVITEKGPEAMTWARAYWASHWDVASPTQANEMLMRLRPTGGPGGAPRDPSKEVFVAADHATLLKTADYSPYWRGKLGAIAYRVIGIRQIRELRRLKQVDRTEMVEMFQDQGYVLRDAKILADLEDGKVTSSETKIKLPAVRSKILRAYKSGMLSRPAAATSLKQLGISTIEGLAKWNALSPAEKTAEAGNDVAVRIDLDSADLDARVDYVQLVTRAVKSSFGRGILSVQQATTRLTNVGLDLARATEFVAAWEAARSQPKRELAAAQILDLTRHGVIQSGEALQRLENLGWKFEDARLLLARNSQLMEVDDELAIAKVAKTAREQQRALEAAVKAADSQRKAVVRQLMQSASPAAIQRYLVRDIITESAARQRLSVYGWSTADIDVWVIDAAGRRAEWLAKRAKDSQRNGQAVT